MRRRRRQLAERAAAIGFREEHGVTRTKNLIGFDDDRDFPNVARGLIARGDGDDEIDAILGDNFLLPWPRRSGTSRRRSVTRRSPVNCSPSGSTSSG